MNGVISTKDRVVEEDCDVYKDYTMEINLKNYGEVVDISKAKIGKVNYISLEVEGEPEIFEDYLVQRFPNAMVRNYISVRYKDKEVSFKLREFLEKMELI